MKQNRCTSWPLSWPDLEAFSHSLGADNPREVIRIPDDVLPASDDGLAGFAEWLVDWQPERQGFHSVVWVQPKIDRLTLTGDEAEQILGLIAGVSLNREDTFPGGRACHVLGGPLRRNLLAVCVLWRQQDLLQSAAGLPVLLPQWLSSAISFIEIPGERSSLPAWECAVRTIVARLGRRGRKVAFGAFVPGPRLARAEIHGATERLREMLAEEGAGELRCQWIDQVDLPGASETILEFAGQHRIEFDFSLCSSSPNGQGPYQEFEPYAPLPFDIRTPSVRRPSPLLVEIPRYCGWCSRVLVERGPRALRPLFSDFQSRLLENLRISLDRTLRASYLARLEKAEAGVDEWNRYHVYNWAPPPRLLTRAVVVEASALAGAASPVNWMADGLRWLGGATRKGPTIISGSEFLDLARRHVERQTHLSASDLTKIQIEGHRYLVGGRKELSEDSKTLLTELPAVLGRTLEIGCGYALTARLLGPRAATYVGFDLLTSQARSLTQAGCHGIVADMHALPFRAGEYDHILADNVLEHAYDPVCALKEIRRVLKPGARLCAIIPFDRRCSSYQIRNHFWKADESSIKKAFQLAGFTIETFRVLKYAELGIYGCFPASAGESSLIIAR